MLPTKSICAIIKWKRICPKENQWNIKINEFTFDVIITNNYII